MKKDKNLDETPINETDKYLFGVIKNISPKLLTELYQMAYEDGWNAMSETEYACSFEVKGFNKVIEELYETTK